MNLKHSQVVLPIGMLSAETIRAILRDLDARTEPDSALREVEVALETALRYGLTRDASHD